MPVVITQTIRPQGMGLNVLVRLLPLYEFCCTYKQVAWKNVQCWHWQHCWHFFWPAGWRMHVFMCTFKVFQANTVKCFETSLGLNSPMFSSLLSSLSWKVLNQISNLALTVLNCNSGPRKKSLIFLKPSACLSLIIWFIIHIFLKQNMVVPVSAATQVKVGALEKFLKPQVGFLWLLSVCLRFGEVTDWLQKPAMPWSATACGLYSFLICLCTGGFMSGWYFPLSKRILEASLLPNKHPFVSFYHWTS